MYNEATDYVSETAKAFAEAQQDKIASAMLETIGNAIGLDSIIEEDEATRQAEFDKAYEAETDEELKAMMKFPWIVFKTTTDRLQYAIQALLAKWLIATHDINWAGVITVKIFKLLSKTEYTLETNYSASLSEAVSYESSKD